MQNPSRRYLFHVLLVASPAAQGQDPIHFGPAPAELRCITDAAAASLTIGFRSNETGMPADMVVACQGTGSTITICSGFSDGAYTSFQTLSLGNFTAYYWPPRIAFGDLDHDGDEDAVVYWNSWQTYAPAQLFVLWWNGPSVTMQTIGGAITSVDGEDAFRSDLTLFDLNDDGLLDIVLNGEWVWTMNPSDNGPLTETLAQTADHQFTSYTPDLPKAYYAYHHDMDGDDREDLLHYTGSALEQYHNAGNDVFVLTTTYPVLGAPGEGEWADIDGDGVADLVRTGYCVQDTLRVMGALLAGGNLGAQEALFKVPLSCRTSIARDLNNDGSLDLLVQQGNAMDTTVIWAGQGGGGWDEAPPLNELVRMEPGWQMAPPVDVDADGDLDLVAVRQGCVAWLENELGEDLQVSLHTGPEVLHPFPDPADRIVHLVFSNSAVLGGGSYAIDALGRRVYAGDVRAMHQDIDVGSWPPGTYFLYVTTLDGGQRWYGRVVVAH